MQIYADKLANQLSHSLAKAYLIAGDDELLRDDAIQLVVAAAKKAGYNDQQKFIHENSSIWAELLDAVSAMSLFAEQRLLVLKLSSAKIGSEGSQAIIECLNRLDEQSVLLIQSPRIEGKPKWVSSISQEGCYVPIYPLDSNRLPNWLMQRAKNAGVILQQDAAALLAERVEGNLVSAVQEIEKLALSCPPNQAISADTIDANVVDNARFSAFNMLDKAIDGDAAGSSHALQTIREEGTDALAVSGAINYQLSMLYELIDYANSSQLKNQLKSKRVQPRRQQAISKALLRLQKSQLQDCIMLLSQADLLYKSGEQQMCWINLECILLTLAGHAELSMRQRALSSEFLAR